MWSHKTGGRRGEVVVPPVLTVSEFNSLCRLKNTKVSVLHSVISLHFTTKFWHEINRNSH